jgi:hypothetical protein
MRNQRIVVSFIRPEGDVSVPAHRAPIRSYMLPLPAGYLPVMFAGDRGPTLVPASRIRAA